MLALINRILDWFKSLFWKEEMELTLVGLQYSGKTTFVNVIAVSLPCIICVFSGSRPTAGVDGALSPSENRKQAGVCGSHGGFVKSMIVFGTAAS